MSALFDSVYMLFGLLGLDAYPTTMGELIPYFLTVSVALSIVYSIFSSFRYWTGKVMGGRIL